MKGYIYRTTNLINGMMYIGQKTADHFLGNGYLGSGLRFKEAVKQYGRENFTVELLEECDDTVNLSERESYWIQYYDAINSPYYYNNMIYNVPGFRGRNHTDETKEKMSETRSGRTYEMSDYQKQRISETHADVSGENNPMYGKHHSEETKQLISQKRTERQTGTKWVNNGINEYYAKGDKLKELLSEGYVFGRLKGQKRDRHISGSDNPMYGKSHSDESKSKISEVKKSKKRHWMTNGIISKLIPESEAQSYFNDGWRYGRV